MYRNSTYDFSRGRWPLTLCLVLVFVFGATAEGVVKATDQRPHRYLDFTQAMAMARHSNPGLLEAKQDHRAAEAFLAVERGRLLPHLILLWDAERSNDPLAVLGAELSERHASYADLGLGGLTTLPEAAAIPPALNQPPYVNEFTTALLLTAPVWSWGARRDTIAAAQAQVLAARNLLRARREALILLVLRRYEAVMVARALLRAAKADEQSQKRILVVTRERARRGLALPSDLLRAQAAEAASILRVEHMESGLQTALAAFRIALGVSPTQPLAPLPLGLRVRLVQQSLTVLEAEGLTANPHLRALEERASSNHHLLNAARAARWPRLSISVEHAWNASTPAFRAPSNSFFADVRWSLFSFGEERGRVALARAHWKASRLALEAARRSLREEIARLWRSVRLAQVRLRVARLSRRADRATAHVMFLRYQHGLGTIGDVLRAQARLVRAQAEVEEARDEFLMSTAALRFAVGRLKTADVFAMRSRR